MAPLSNKTLVLIRHAHRDTSTGRELDNGLSKKGVKQAKRLKAFFQKRFGNECDSVVLYCSPKVRCRQTLEPLAEWLESQIQINELLLEQTEGREPKGKNLEARVLEFIQRWSNSAHPLTVACSHGDWLQLLLTKLSGAELSFKKGAWAELESKAGRIRLTWLVQRP